MTMDTIRDVINGVLESPTLTSSLCVAGIYATYYLTCVVKKPFIACGDSRLRDLISQHCPVAEERFWPTWWCTESRVMTVLRAFIQTYPDVHYEAEHLETPDKGEIILDWNENDGNNKYTKDERPTVLMLPGLTGSSSENYIKHMVLDAAAMGYRSVVFNNRGTGSSTLKTPRTYCAANIEDTDFVVNHIKEKYPQAPLMGVGVSLGGCVLFNYLARMGKQSKLVAGLTISSAFNFHLSSANLQRPVNYWIFNRHLAKNLVNIFRKNITLFENHPAIDAQQVLKSQSIKQFDESFTSKMFGYDSVDHYYTDASLHTKVHQLTKPVLCLSAADDPFAPLHSIPIDEAQNNKNIAIAVTSHGGHIGFLEGTFPRYYINKWFKQFTTAIFSKEKEKKDD